MDGHIEKLEKRISALIETQSKLGTSPSLKELLKIIRFPGYTTPAELGFTLALVDSLHAQLAQILKTEHDLVEAAKLVISEPH